MSEKGNYVSDIHLILVLKHYKTILKLFMFNILCFYFYYTICNR